MGIVELGFGAVSMPHRRIGQEVFGFGADAGRRSCLEELRALIEWSVIERLLDPIHCAAKGEPAWPPWALFVNRRRGHIAARIGNNSLKAFEKG